MTIAPNAARDNALRSLAEVSEENGRLRERIAQLEAVTMPLLDRPLPDHVIDYCVMCRKPFPEGTDLCEDCDDRAPLPCDGAE